MEKPEISISEYQDALKDGDKLIQDLETLKKEILESKFNDIKELDKVSKKVSRLMISTGRSGKTPHYPSIKIGIVILVEAIDSTIADLEKMIAAINQKISQLPPS